MIRIAIASAALLALWGCQALAPKRSLAGTWTVEGDKFLLPMAESSTGKVTYTADRFTFNVNLTLKEAQGTVGLKVEGSYRLDGPRYHHMIDKIEGDTTNVLSGSLEYVEAQIAKPETRVLLNQVGAAKIDFVSEDQATVAGNDGKKMKLIRSR